MLLYHHGIMSLCVRAIQPYSLDTSCMECPSETTTVFTPPFIVVMMSYLDPPHNLGPFSTGLIGCLNCEVLLY